MPNGGTPLYHSPLLTPRRPLRNSAGSYCPSIYQNSRDPETSTKISETEHVASAEDLTVRPWRMPNRSLAAPSGPWSCHPRHYFQWRCQDVVARGRPPVQSLPVLATESDISFVPTSSGRLPSIAASRLVD